MYKSPDYDYEQLSFINFNTTCGLQLDPNNEWFRISRSLLWRAWETLISLGPSSMQLRSLSPMHQRLENEPGQAGRGMLGSLKRGC